MSDITTSGVSEAIPHAFKSKPLRGGYWMARHYLFDNIKDDFIKTITPHKANWSSVSAFKEAIGGSLKTSLKGASLFLNFVPDLALTIVPKSIQAFQAAANPLQGGLAFAGTLGKGLTTTLAGVAALGACGALFGPMGIPGMILENVAFGKASDLMGKLIGFNKDENGKEAPKTAGEKINPFLPKGGAAVDRLLLSSIDNLPTGAYSASPVPSFGETSDASFSRRAGISAFAMPESLTSSDSDAPSGRSRAVLAGLDRKYGYSASNG